MTTSDAITRLKELSEDNTDMANRLEAENLINDERMTRLIRTYRWWSQCLSMAAWLLEEDANGNV